MRWSGQAEGRVQFSLPTMLSLDSSRGQPGQRPLVCWSSQLCRADRVKCFIKPSLVRKQPSECGKPGLKQAGDLTLLVQCRYSSSRGHTLPTPQYPKAADFLSAQTQSLSVQDGAAGAMPDLTTEGASEEGHPRQRHILITRQEQVPSTRLFDPAVISPLHSS